MAFIVPAPHPYGIFNSTHVRVLQPVVGCGQGLSIDEREFTSREGSPFFSSHLPGSNHQT